MEIKDNSREREEFLLILNAFRKMIYSLENSAESMNHFQDMVIYRASALMERALEGLKIDFDRALELLQAKNISISAREELERDTLIAAFDNLIDFATAEEYAMIQELPEEIDLNDMEIYDSICQKYNEQYAIVENEQVLHAVTIAYFWLGTSAETIITYNTQNDERVRAWHQSFDGLSYKKSEFPPELIPPIEWACRCYLTSDGYGYISNSILKPTI
ncbi:MAG: phage minor head protein, partial [Rikenellaceae bacterium]